MKNKMSEKWSLKKLGDICNVSNGYAFKSEDYVNEGVLNFRVSNFQEESRINIKENVKYLPISFLKEYKKYQLKEKDILLVMVGASRGKIARIPNLELPLLQNQNMWRIRSKKNDLDQDFLFYRLSQDVKIFDNMSGGSARSFYKKSDFKQMKLFIPPFVEQRGIVEVLSTVDKAIQQTDAIIERVEELKRGLLQQLLTRGIGHTEYKETPLGMIPETWKIVPLKKHINIQSGNYFKYEEFVPEGIRVLKIDNVSYNEIIWDTITYLPREYLDSFSELSLNENDIIMALNRPITNDKLKLGIIKKGDTPSILYQRVGRLITKNPLVLNPNFLYYYMSTGYFMNELKRIFRGTDQPYVNPTEIVTLKMPIPPKIEQEKIIEIIKNQDALIDLEKQKQKQLNQVKQGLIQQLLSGKTRVELKGDGLHRIRDGRKANN